MVRRALHCYFCDCKDGVLRQELTASSPCPVPKFYTRVCPLYSGGGVRTVSEEGFSETPATRASSLAGRRRPAFGIEVFKISTNNTILNEAARFPSSFHPYPPYLIRSWRSSERTSWNGATSSRRMTTSCGGLRCWWDR